MDLLRIITISLLTSTTVHCFLGQGNITETRTHQPYGEEIKISAEDGKLLSTVDVFFNEDYQIERPTNRNKCVISKITGNATCFDEALIPNIDTIPDNVAVICKGREVITLASVDCNKDDNVATVGTETTGETNRKKRSAGWSTCTRWVKVYRENCRAWCCRQFIFCFQWCRSCETYYAWVPQYVKGYESRPYWSA